MRMEKRRVLVTGAATGIGCATAKLLAREGAFVTIADINQEMGKKTIQDINENYGSGWFYPLDVRDEKQVRIVMDSVLRDMGGIDVLINSVGVQKACRMESMDISEWDAVFEVNVRGVYLCIKHAIAMLRDSSHGVIINMASGAGIKGGPGMCAYAGSKGALIAISRTLAIELAPDGIRVNAVCPGWIDTPFNGPAIDFIGG